VAPCQCLLVMARVAMVVAYLYPPALVATASEVVFLSLLAPPSLLQVLVVLCPLQPVTIRMPQVTMADPFRFSVAPSRVPRVYEVEVQCPCKLAHRLEAWVVMSRLKVAAVPAHHLDP
jgi:hypothetical protein